LPVEAQAQLLASIHGADLKGVALVQRWFRRWQAKRALAIRAKMRSSRLTMDAAMASRLALGKRRTMDANSANTPGGGSSAAATPTAARSGRQSPTHAYLSVPSAHSITTAGGVSSSSASCSSSSSGSLTLPTGTVTGDDATLSAKKRASMQRMLLIQSRFRADGTLEVTAAKEGDPLPSSRAAARQQQAAMDVNAAAVATQAAAQAAAAAAAVDDDSDRRGARLNNRRRTFSREESAAAASATAAPSSSSSSSSTSKSVAPALATTFELPSAGSSGISSSSSSSVADKHLRFIRLVVRLQRRFKAHRAMLKARLEEKIKAQQRRQTMDADRKLRRASMPMGNLGAIRNRLSLGPAAADAKDIVK
jgi:hypothetical protein